jgi:hypothetical protein
MAQRDEHRQGREPVGPEPMEMTDDEMKAEIEVSLANGRADVLLELELPGPELLPKLHRALCILSKAGGGPGIEYAIKRELAWASKMVVRFIESFPPADAEKRFARPRRPAQANGQEGENLVPIPREMKRRMQARLFEGVGSYLREDADRIEAGRRRRGRPDQDRRATIALYALVRKFWDEHPKATHNAICEQAATRLAAQESIDDGRRPSAVAVWKRNMQAATRRLEDKGRRWEPTSAYEAVVADVAKRGERLGVKVPEE